MLQKKKFTRTVLATASLLAATPTFAKNPLVLSIGFDLGGENVSDVTMEDGDSVKIKANQGLSLAAGFRIPTTSNTEFQTTIAWQNGGVSASNGKVNWISLPVEGTYLVKLNKFLLGGGVSYFLNPKQKTEDVGKEHADNINYENSLGYHLKLAYGAEASKYRLGAKYSIVEFDPKEEGETIDGDSLGFFWEFSF